MADSWNNADKEVGKDLVKGTLIAGGPKAVPSGTFMFGAMACGGQWIYSKASRYRQNQILAANPDLESTLQEKNKDAIGSGILNVLPVHRTDVDDYETRLRNKLHNIELEQKMLEEEVLRRKQAATQEAVDSKTI
ncbi:hypothetical protein BGZ74_000399 [Mortierella antarctica]|nr:hypothetical protein BGZ74_000399 [Mortierella antarctica]